MNINLQETFGKYKCLLFLEDMINNETYSKQQKNLIISALGHINKKFKRIEFIPEDSKLYFNKLVREDCLKKTRESQSEFMIKDIETRLCCFIVAKSNEFLKIKK